MATSGVVEGIRYYPWTMSYPENLEDHQELWPAIGEVYRNYVADVKGFLPEGRK